MIKTKLVHKIILFIFSVFLTILFLEAGLRVAEKAYLGSQEMRNRHSLASGAKINKKVIRILCVGESTTAFGGEDSYPSQLEKILNQRGKFNFEVINKGVPATTTDKIVANLDRYLEEYNPQMVVAMMGVNDGKETQTFNQQHQNIFRELKIVKLYKLLRSHIQHRWQVNTVEDYLKLAMHYKEEGQISQQKAMLEKVDQLFPNNVKVILQLGEFYQEINDFQEAEKQYKKVLDNSSTPPMFKLATLSALAECYVKQKRFSQAETIYRKLVKIPGADKILMYDLLTEVYLEKEEYGLAIETFYQRIAINPKGIPAYMKVARAFRQLKRFDELKSVLEKGMAVHSPLEQNYQFLSSEMDYSLDPKPRTNQYYGLNTIKNYEQLKEVLFSHKISLIAMQYPMRSVDPLKEILQNDSRIVFVDNEAIFKKALKSSTYDEYFLDHFGGDFGHCTARGNFLLADHLADIILNEVMNK